MSMKWDEAVCPICGGSVMDHPMRGGVTCEAGAMDVLGLVCGWDDTEPPAMFIGSDRTLWRGDSGLDSEVRAEAEMTDDGHVQIVAMWVRVLPAEADR